MKEAFQAEGDVETLDLLAALCALGREGSTGRAIFSRGSDRIVFVVERGVLVDLEAPGESSAPEVLVRSGKLQRETYEALVIPPGEDRFAIATASGVVSKKEAAWGRKISAIESLAHLLSWTEGSYVFEPLAPEISTGFRLPIDKWILELFLRSNDRALVMSHVGPTDLPLLKSDSFAPAFAALGLTADADAVASLIDGERSVEEIVRKSRADEFAVLKLLAALISLRLVRPSYESPFPGGRGGARAGRRAADVPADGFRTFPRRPLRSRRSRIPEPFSRTSRRRRPRSSRFLFRFSRSRRRSRRERPSLWPNRPLRSRPPDPVGARGCGPRSCSPFSRRPFSGSSAAGEPRLGGPVPSPFAPGAAGTRAPRPGKAGAFPKIDRGGRAAAPVASEIAA